MNKTRKDLKNKELRDKKATKKKKVELKTYIATLVFLFLICAANIVGIALTYPRFKQGYLYSHKFSERVGFITWLAPFVIILFGCSVCIIIILFKIYKDKKEKEAASRENI